MNSALNFVLKGWQQPPDQTYTSQVCPASSSSRSQTFAKLCQVVKVDESAYNSALQAGILVELRDPNSRVVHAACLFQVR